MTRSRVFETERSRIEEQFGYYISLDDVAQMMKIAQKVVSIINSYSCYATSYQEAKIILRLADKALQEITGGIDQWESQF